MSRSLITISSLLLTLILGVSLLYPEYQEFTTLKEKIKARSTELQSREEYFSNLSNISKRLKEYEKELSLINSALPSDPSLPALFDFLQKTASQNGLVLKTMSPSPQTTLAKLKETQIKLQLVGSYPSLKSFLSDLEKSSRIIEVDSLSFATPEEIGPFTFDLVIKVYSY